MKDYFVSTDDLLVALREAIANGNDLLSFRIEDKSLVFLDAYEEDLFDGVKKISSAPLTDANGGSASSSPDAPFPRIFSFSEIETLKSGNIQQEASLLDDIDGIIEAYR